MRYEDLVSDPENVMRKLCDELNIEYQDMTNYGQRIESMSNYQIVGMGDATSLRKHTKPEKKFIDDWPQFLDTSQKVYYAKSWLKGIGKELFTDLGYSYDDAMSILESKPVDDKEVHSTWDLISDPELSYDRIKQQETKDLEHSAPARIFRIKDNNSNTHPSPIVKVWECRFGSNKGNKFLFHADGTYEQFFAKKNSSILGKYSTDESVTPHRIDLEIEEHHAGNEGTTLGIFEIQDEILAIAIGTENKERIIDTDNYHYWYEQPD